MTLQEAITARHSVRKYIDKEIPADIVTVLQDKIAEYNKVGNLNIQLVLNETRAFTGMLSYGSFSGVRNYFVMVGKKGADLDERVGYYGEQLVLLAQTLGLNTCWVGLSYRKVPEAYNVGKDEKLACMIALGYGHRASEQCQRSYSGMVQEGSGSSSACPNCREPAEVFIRICWHEQ